MNAISQELFRFLHPEYFYALAFVALMLMLFWLRLRWKKQAIAKFGEWQLVQKLVEDLSPAKWVTKFVLIALAFVLLTICLARPQIGTTIEEAKREGIDLVFALDLSNSMLAEDIAPNRLERAKQSIVKLCERMKGNQVGLVVFAGEAFQLMPLTSDLSAFKLFLQSANTRTIEAQGTSIGKAIDLSRKILVKYSQRKRAIVLITDGENFDDNPIEAARKAASDKVPVYCLGVGLPAGAPIPNLVNGIRMGYKKEADGTTIITKLDADMLTKIAEAGQGTFVRSGKADIGLEALYNDINKIEKTGQMTRGFSNYDEKFYPLLALALILIIIELLISERKSKLWKRLNLFGEK